MDKSAVGFEYQSKTEKHESQKGLSCIHCLTNRFIEDLSVIFPVMHNIGMILHIILFMDVSDCFVLDS